MKRDNSKILCFLRLEIIWSQQPINHMRLDTYHGKPNVSILCDRQEAREGTVPWIWWVIHCRQGQETSWFHAYMIRRPSTACSDFVERWDLCAIWSSGVAQNHRDLGCQWRRKVLLMCKSRRPNARPPQRYCCSRGLYQLRQWSTPQTFVNSRLNWYSRYCTLVETSQTIRIMRTIAAPIKNTRPSTPQGPKYRTWPTQITVLITTFLSDPSARQIFADHDVRSSVAQVQGPQQYSAKDSGDHTFTYTYISQVGFHLSFSVI